MDAQEMKKLALANANKIIDKFYLDCKGTIRQAALEGQSRCSFKHDELKKAFVMEVLIDRLKGEGFRIAYKDVSYGIVHIEW